MQAVFGSLDLIQEMKSQYAVEETICPWVKQWFYFMPQPLLFRPSWWGAEKQFIKNLVDGKVLSNLVSDDIKISTYCATDKDSISNLLISKESFFQAI